MDNTHQWDCHVKNFAIIGLCRFRFGSLLYISEIHDVLLEEFGPILLDTLIVFWHIFMLLPIGVWLPLLILVAAFAFTPFAWLPSVVSRHLCLLQLTLSASCFLLPLSFLHNFVCCVANAIFFKLIGFQQVTSKQIKKIEISCSNSVNSINWII